MSNWVEKLLDITVIGNDQSMVKGALANLADRFDFVGYAFVNIRPGQIYAVSNYDIDWQKIYDTLDYRFIDPVMWQAQLIKRAFAWSGEADKSSLSKKQKNFFSKAADFNIRSGVSIPVATANGAMSMLTFASAKPSLASDKEIDAIMAASAVSQLHTRLEHLRVTPSIEEKIVLTPKQVNYIRWLSLGKTVEVIAELEQAKYAGVRSAIDDVRTRYNLANHAQVVAWAIRRGLI
ncbi:autoinducer-binding transcriptional regulator TraR [Agrobacterium vitis]|uniref:autoinducer-binding transcriptional regulator TraR n=1 Tax=Agrobacterium vitis TaxID=373 RepID=UPI0008DC2286|nr:transcriptional regulator TraR [Agrobacterium vitis]MUO85229.1 transcriptional regulator TraR [Agrobacterium vitis]